MKSKIYIIFLLTCSYMISTAQMYRSDQPFAHTYSIVCYDDVTGEMGVAVQSHWFQVGPIVAWGEAGVGVVATQSLVNPAFGPNGLALMKMGFTAKKVLAMLVEEDEGRTLRQVAMCDAKGNVSVHTGDNCIQPAGHIEGVHYTVQANLMSNDKIWPAMSKAFESSKGKPLAERMIDALNAAEAAGGDIRGKQSAALLVVAGEATGKPWVDRIVDLRVDDHADPLGELSRLYQIHRAYKYMNDGDLAMEHEDVDGAIKAYGSAMKLNPENEEMKFWYAISLANSGYLKKALPLFKSIFNKNDNWRTLTPRLIDNGLLQLNDQELKEVLAQ